MEKNSFEVMRDLAGYFKEGERKAIYNAADSSRDKLLIRLLWITGRRIGEILKIKVNEVDVQNKSLIIHVEKKSNKDFASLSYIDEFTLNFINTFIIANGLKDNDYIFKSSFKGNNPISRQRAFQIIRKACDKAGINKVGKTKPHPHHFRHSFAIDQAKNMKNPSDVRKLQMALNHSTLAVTEKYLRFADEEIKNLPNNVGN